MAKKVSFIWRLFSALLMMVVSVNIVPVQAENLSDAEALLQTMSPEERVGQLFLVTFDGTDIGEESEIYRLITEHHIGGVVLLAENNNFIQEDTVPYAQRMIERIQRLTWDASLGAVEVEGFDDISQSTYIPMFIGLKQIGDGFPGDQILTGLTQLPSQMSIGATWDTELASRVGEVLGRELSALGVNLYLGPNLDVLETANSEAASSLGVNTYGGDPFWVGEMGKSFISGLHEGSDNQMLVVAQNFPGTGNSDRSPEFEVATVRKSLEQLKQIELAPYFSVTDLDVNDPGRVDAVMVSHIRYQGFQGNIRATTRPISFDSNALQQIMSLPQLARWRENGGLIISDNLGSGSVRRFFDPNDVNFEARQVARNAFLAGNDMLYLDNFIASGDPDSLTTLLSTLDFFVQKYREDSTFAQRVDASVLRILEAKLDLFGEFSIGNVISSGTNIRDVGGSQDVTFDVAQNAVTLINPKAQELDTVLPRAPIRYEDIVIFTDVRSVSQCDPCPSINNVSINGLGYALNRIYGPQAGGQILQQNIFSYTFKQLTDILDNPEDEEGEFLLLTLRSADWVIFNTLNIDPAYPESTALQRVLAERPDLIAEKNVIVFALGSPTYLDSTNISKVTAYYALYSKAPAFLDIAARVLMKELDPPGALPVSLNAVGYDLINATSPDPSQVIGLELVVPEGEEVESIDESTEITPTPVPPSLPNFTVGDTITVRTSRIMDHNNNIVPDGTIVRFSVRISGETAITQQIEATTAAGVAFLNYRFEAPGSMDIVASSEPAMQSETLQLNISPSESPVVIEATPTPTSSPTPTETPTATATELPTPVSTPVPEPKQFPSLGEWALGVIVIGIGGGLAFLIGYFWWGSSRWGLRSFLCALIGGLLSYTYLNLGIEGTKFWISESGTLFVIEIIVVGLLIGWLGALIWWMRTEGRYPSRNRHRKG